MHNKPDLSPVVAKGTSPNPDPPLKCPPPPPLNPTSPLNIMNDSSPRPINTGTKYQVCPGHPFTCPSFGAVFGCPVIRVGRWWMGVVEATLDQFWGGGRRFVWRLGGAKSGRRVPVITAGSACFCCCVWAALPICHLPITP